MDLNTFITIYQEFLNEGRAKGWMVEILIEEFGNHLASITNQDGIEVEFFIELDLENDVCLSEKTRQTTMDYGVLRKKGEGDFFAKEVLDSFHHYWAKKLSKRSMSFIVHKRS